MCIQGRSPAADYPYLRVAVVLFGLLPPVSQGIYLHKVAMSEDSPSEALQVPMQPPSIRHHCIGRLFDTTPPRSCSRGFA
ncbi:hypothetical protein F5Y01DRAFT_286697 [Xylaria sp. FL0043]|nr:hypothetical protein F5Y01DRAFT_286697 [Xylaria sp. FL0043]